MKPKGANIRMVKVVHVSLLMIVLLVGQSFAAQAGATYYVSTAGNDSNAGTFSSPWLTIQRAANSASAGATVYVFGGLFSPRYTWKGGFTQNLSESHSFTASTRPPVSDRRWIQAVIFQEFFPFAVMHALSQDFKSGY